MKAPRLREVYRVYDMASGMMLERVAKTMKGRKFNAALVVNAKRSFNPKGYSYVRTGMTWTLFGCPKGVKARTAKGKVVCSKRGLNAQVAQHVLYQDFAKAYAYFRDGRLQKTWANHRKKLRELRRMK